MTANRPPITGKWFLCHNGRSHWFPHGKGASSCGSMDTTRAYTQIPLTDNMRGESWCCSTCTRRYEAKVTAMLKAYEEERNA